MMEQTAASQQTKKGQYGRILAGLQPIQDVQEEDDGRRTDPDLMDSYKSTEKITQAKNTIR